MQRVGTKRARGRLWVAGAVVAYLLVSAAASGGVAPTARARSSRTAAKPAAVSFPGSVSLKSPGTNSALRGPTTITWSWQPGTLVKSTSRVEYQLSSDGGALWTTVASAPIRDGSMPWNTSGISDYAYTTRLLVSGTWIFSTQSPVYVDNTEPVVHVSRPTEGQVLVENDTRIFFATVIGRARIEAASWDNLSGVKVVTWLLDGAKIGEGSPYVYNFSAALPGFHDLTAVATDRAGNSASHTIKILTAPGTSAVETVPTPRPCPPPSTPVPVNPCPLPVQPATAPTPPAAPVQPCPLPANGLPVQPCPLPGLP